MLELLKKYGVPAGISAVITVAITIVPIGYQWHTTSQQNARITSLETQCSR